jgi:hypothetical protein
VFFARLNALRRGEQIDDGSAGEEAEPAPASGADAPASGAEADAQGAPADESTGTVVAAEEQPVEEHDGEQPAVEGSPVEEPVAEAQETEQPAAQEPAVEEPGAEGSDAEQPAPGRRAVAPPPVSQARLAAAIQRVGGPEIVEEALRPKMDEQGERKKWALVCCEAAQGRQAGDPEFTAWLRLAATPVREVKASLPVPKEQGRGGARRGGGPGRGGDRAPRDGGGDRGRGGGPGRGGDRGRGDRGVSREELEAFARGGSLTSRVRIVDPAAEKRERERQRKEERERKRQAERERLARLGY